MTTNVPQASWQDQGFTSPSVDDLYTGTFADINAAFNGLISNSDKSTPQGQLAMSLAVIIEKQNDFLAFLCNQFDPSYASGRFQLGLARATGITPTGATPTVVTATCSGLSGYVISENALAIASDGTLYRCLQDVTIPGGGSIDVQFEAMTYGAIDCPAGSLNRIYRTSIGWDSITNKASGITGRDAETREEFESRRIRSTAINARSVDDAIEAAILSISGVKDAWVQNNSEGSPQSIQGVTIDPHSIYACVEGGADSDIAQAILSKKPPGCGMTGNTSVIATNNSHKYTIKFQRASNPSVDISVSLEASDNVPDNAGQQIEAVIRSKFADEAKIGTDLLASVFYCPVASLGSWVRIKSILINGSVEYNAPADSYPVCGNVSVAVS